MIRALYLDQDDARTLDLAERYVRLLKEVEYAHATGDNDEITAILAGIDPVDVKVVAGELLEFRTAYDKAPIRVGTVPRATSLTHAEPLPGNSRGRSDGAVPVLPRSAPCA